MGMNVEYLKTWLREETREKDPDTENWDKLVIIMKLEFRDGYILEALACQGGGCGWARPLGR